MNIFILSTDPLQAAKWHCDKHVVKMILETFQVLCAAFHLQGIEAPYKLTHKNHPCTKWAMESKENFEWVLSLGRALCDEYTERYKKIHKSVEVYNWIVENKAKLTFPKTEQTPFILAMPDEYKTSDPVESYRNYYRSGKKHLHNWKQNKPNWL